MPEPEPTSPPAPDAVAALAAALLRVAALAEGGGIVPEALSPSDAAVLCGVSKSSWFDWDSRGLVPKPIELGDRGCRRWLRRELIAWLTAGAPSRVVWQQVREQTLRRAAG